MGFSTHEKRDVFVFWIPGTNRVASERGQTDRILAK